jgi:hypothetical protein
MSSDSKIWSNDTSNLLKEYKDDATSLANDIVELVTLVHKGINRVTDKKH